MSGGYLSGGYLSGGICPRIVITRAFSFHVNGNKVSRWFKIYKRLVIFLISTLG